jgi:hypothetical protein
MKHNGVVVFVCNSVLVYYLQKLLGVFQLNLVSAAYYEIVTGLNWSVVEQQTQLHSASIRPRKFAHKLLKILHFVSTGNIRKQCGKFETKLIFPVRRK